jgi:hypothetical protein
MEGHGSGAQNPEAGNGRVEFDVPAPGVFVFRLKGRMHADLVPQFERAVAPSVERRMQLDLFFDTREMNGYHPAFRERMTAWHEALKPNTRSANVYIGSKFVAMAIAIVNMMTGGLLKTYSDYTAFEGAVGAAVRQAARRAAE